MRLSPKSLRFRLTLLFAAVTTAAVALLGVYLDYALAAQLAAREREQLAAKLRLFTHVLSETGSSASLEESRHRLADVLAGHEGLHASVLDGRGKPLLELSPFPWRRLPVVETGVEDFPTVQGVPYRSLIAPARLGGGEPVLVALAQSRVESRQILHRFHETVILACVLGSLAAGALGYFAAVRGLRPLGRIVRAATAISAERLDDRLDVKDAPLELQDMAQSFNAMLARLESSFRRLTEFSADLAHELRTPLNNLMLQAQVALDKPRDETQLRQVLSSGLEELERLSRLVNDMLFIAKADHSQIVLAGEDFVLEQEVAKVFDYFEAVAEERGVHLACEGTASVTGDRAMVRRMIANLVSNAVRHAEDGSTVRVRLSSAGSAALLEVQNRGVPLAASDATRVFDRFYRAQTSRTVATEGAGLGLAIVKSIVELHGGEASVASSPTGTTFRVTLGAPRLRRPGHPSARHA